MRWKILVMRWKILVMRWRFSCAVSDLPWSLINLHLFAITSAPGHLHLQMMFTGFLQAEIDTLRGHSEYNNILLADHSEHPPARAPAEATAPSAQSLIQGGQAGSSTAPEPSTSSEEPPKKKPNTRKSPRGSPAAAAKPSKKPAISRLAHSSDDPVIEGKKPKKTKRLKDRGLPLANIYNLNDSNQVTRLQEYLADNGGWELFHTPKNGQCLWSAARKGIELPEEYRNDHLRYQLIYFCVKNHGFCFTVLKTLIEQEYGQKRVSREEYIERMTSQDNPLTDREIARYNKPGPFTFLGYLTHMMHSSSWGDHGVITIMSMMWQITITILNAEYLTQIKIRHARPIQDVDLLLIFSGQSHYLGACEYFLHLSL